MSHATTAEIQNYMVVPDRGYTIRQVSSDSTLPFVANDSLRPLKEPVYWIKIKIHNPFHYNIRLIPYLNNTLYYHDANSHSWVARKAGVKAGLINRSQRNIARMSFMLKANISIPCTSGRT